MCYSYILHINLLSDIIFTNIFSLSIGGLFILLMISFAVQNLLVWCGLIAYFRFCCLAFSVRSKKSLPNSSLLSWCKLWAYHIRTFVTLSYISSILTLLRDFITSGRWILPNAFFCVRWDNHFTLHFVNVAYHWLICGCWTIIASLKWILLDHVVWFS